MHDDSRDHDDYVWHFKLSEREGVRPAPEDALAEMVREQIEALLRCVAFTHHGADVTVTGFRLLGEGEREHLLRTSLAAGGSDASERLQGSSDDDGR